MLCDQEQAFVECTNICGFRLMVIVCRLHLERQLKLQWVQQVHCRPLTLFVILIGSRWHLVAASASKQDRSNRWSVSRF
jgi:hypothetical protein